MRRARARPYRAPVPVICVGNVVAGGSGKTPVVLSLIALLNRSGVAAHVVTRGYGGRLPGPVRVDLGVHDADAVGDEPLLLAAKAPCWVARDRAAGVREAVRSGAAAILLDDGFQNPSVQKDCSLVVVDAAYGFGNGQVIPAGPLREPAGSGIARADAVVLIGPGAVPAEAIAAGKPVHRAGIEPVGGDRLRGQKIVAFAGIGRPAKFFATLGKLGAELVGEHGFADHHRYSAAEISRLREVAERSRAHLVTTAKDHVRLSPELRDGIEALQIEIRWRDEAAMAHLLADVAGKTIIPGFRDSARD